MQNKWPVKSTRAGDSDVRCSLNGSMSEMVRQHVFPCYGSLARSMMIARGMWNGQGAGMDRWPGRRMELFDLPMEIRDPHAAYLKRRQRRLRPAGGRKV